MKKNKTLFNAILCLSGILTLGLTVMLTMALIRGNIDMNSGIVLVYLFLGIVMMILGYLLRSDWYSEKCIKNIDELIAVMPEDILTHKQKEYEDLPEFSKGQLLIESSYLYYYTTVMGTFKGSHTYGILSRCLCNAQEQGYEIHTDFFESLGYKHPAELLRLLDTKWE